MLPLWIDMGDVLGGGWNVAHGLQSISMCMVAIRINNFKVFLIDSCDTYKQSQGRCWKFSGCLPFYIGVCQGHQISFDLHGTCKQCIYVFRNAVVKLSLNLKMRHQERKQEILSLNGERWICRSGQRGSGQFGTMWQGWKMQEWTMRHHVARVDSAGVGNAGVVKCVWKCVTLWWLERNRWLSLTRLTVDNQHARSASLLTSWKSPTVCDISSR